MRRKLTIYTVGNASFSTTVEHEHAEQILSYWRDALIEESEVVTVQIDGTPVMHVALASIVGIADEMP